MTSGETRNCTILDSVRAINNLHEQNCIVMSNDLGSLHGCHDDDGELEKDIKKIFERRCEATYKIESFESDSYKAVFHLRKLLDENNLDNEISMTGSSY